MAYPTVSARTGGGTTTTNTTSHAITLSTHAAGDLLLVHFAVDGNPTVSVNAGSSSAGWQLLGQASNGTAVTGAILWLLCTGASHTLTLTTSASEQSTHTCLTLQAGASNTEYSVEGTSTNGSSTNSDPPNLDITGGISYHTLWVATRAGDSTVVATGAPSSFSNLQTQTASGTSGASSNTAERSLSAASLNPGTFTSTTEQWVSWTVGIRLVRAPTSTLKCIQSLGDLDDINDTVHGSSLDNLVVLPGDLLIVIVGVDGSPSSVTVSTPTAGFYRINGAQGIGDAALHVFAFESKILGDAVGSFAVTLNASEMATFSFFVFCPGTNKILRLENIRCSIATHSGTAPNPPSVALDGTRNAAYAVCAMVGGTSAPTAAPTNYTNFGSNTSSSSEGISTARARRNDLNASSEDPGAFTHAISTGGMVTTIVVWEDAGHGGMLPLIM